MEEEEKMDDQITKEILSVADGVETIELDSDPREHINIIFIGHVGMTFDNSLHMK